MNDEKATRFDQGSARQVHRHPRPAARDRQDRSAQHGSRQAPARCGQPQSGGHGSALPAGRSAAGCQARRSRRGERRGDRHLRRGDRAPREGSQAGGLAALRVSLEGNGEAP